jgi:hypothetical protein
MAYVISGVGSIGANSTGPEPPPISPAASLTESTERPSLVAIVTPLSAHQESLGGSSMPNASRAMAWVNGPFG